MRFVTSMVVLLLLALSAGSDIHAQLCGKSFAKFVVVDSEDKSVPDVTIELVAELPNEEYLKYKTRKGYVEYGSFNFKLSPSDAEQLLSRAVPITRGMDACGNPLKLRANSTPVRTSDDFAKRHEGSVRNFGFCGSEGYDGVTVLKISAPGYVTDYYVGSYLRGCFYRYSFVLTQLSKD